MCVVDSNKQVIQLNDEKYKPLRNEAENRSVLIHYCKLDSLEKILQTKSLLLNNLKKVGKQSNNSEILNIDSIFQGIIFISCMTHNYSRKNEKTMWSDFGDNGKGAKLIFKEYSIPFHNSVFDKESKVKAYSKSGGLIYNFGFGISSVKKSEICLNCNFHTCVVVELILSDVIYNTKDKSEKKEINIDVDTNKYLNLSSVSRTVLTKFNDEFETRIIAILRSVSEVSVDEISYLLIPLDFNKFEMEIEFGHKLKQKDKNRINQLIKDMNLNKVHIR